MLSSPGTRSGCLVEDDQLDLTEPRGVGEELNLDGLFASDREREYDTEPSAGGHTAPGVPFTSARWRTERPLKGSATAGAPRISMIAPMRTAAGSARSTTSGSSTVTSVEIPVAPGSRNAATTSRRRVRSASGTVVAPCTRRRARLASCRAGARASTPCRLEIDGDRARDVHVADPGADDLEHRSRGLRPARHHGVAPRLQSASTVGSPIIPRSWLSRRCGRSMRSQ